MWHPCPPQKLCRAGPAAQKCPRKERSEVAQASLYAGSRVCANRGNVSLRTLSGQKGLSLYEPQSDRKGEEGVGRLENWAQRGGGREVGGCKLCYSKKIGASPCSCPPTTVARSTPVSDRTKLHPAGLLHGCWNWATGNHSGQYKLWFPRTLDQTLSPCSRVVRLQEAASDSARRARE